MNGNLQKVRRRQLAARDKGICWLCGGSVDADQFSIDHIIPVSLGGSHGLENLKVAHKQCNERRGNAPGIAFERIGI